MRRQTFRVVPAGLARDVVVVEDVRVHGARDGGGGERDARAESETDSGHHEARCDVRISVAVVGGESTRERDVEIQSIVCRDADVNQRNSQS